LRRPAVVVALDRDASGAPTGSAEAFRSRLRALLPVPDRPLGKCILGGAPRLAAGTRVVVLGERARPALLPERINLDPADIERGLAGLVLTLVEFLRQVLERQAIRRMEGGSLSDDEVEQVGLALMRLEQKIGEIAKQFGLDQDDIQLRIGAAS